MMGNTWPNSKNHPPRCCWHPRVHGSCFCRHSWGYPCSALLLSDGVCPSSDKELKEVRARLEHVRWLCHVSFEDDGLQEREEKKKQLQAEKDQRAKERKEQMEERKKYRHTPLHVSPALMILT